ncbi:hypothetical protein ACS86_17610 [Vibrio alginolyticus]|nr:hypothetical protein ACS86_17610 [Vibrio alginolyticus]
MINHSYLEKSSDLLARHVSVHNEVFGFSVRKLLPIPFLFKKIDYAYLWSESDEIYHELSRLITDIQENPLTLKRDEILIKYLSALSESSRYLSILLKRLSQKSSGISNYQKSEYNSDLETYERSQEKYSKLGIKLNEHLA